MIDYITFPAVSNADKDGLLAMGGDLHVNTLISAYHQGVFPWFNEGQPILWWSPDPRMVLYPDQVKVSRSLRKKLKQKPFRLSCNTAFSQVVEACALRGKTAEDADKEATWITNEMHHAYLNLHKQAYAHSIEVWSEDQLVGGLYGVAIGDVFFGESMFSSANDASKIALTYLCKWLKKKNFKIIDCQVANDHLLSLGAREIPRADFLRSLNNIQIHQSHPTFSTGFEHFVRDSDITEL